jgi:hypothetical protein
LGALQLTSSLALVLGEGLPKWAFTNPIDLKALFAPATLNANLKPGQNPGSRAPRQHYHIIQKEPQNYQRAHVYPPVWEVLRPTFLKVSISHFLFGPIVYSQLAGLRLQCEQPLPELNRDLTSFNFLNDNALHETEKALSEPKGQCVEAKRHKAYAG